jgi:hypothetical protein
MGCSRLRATGALCPSGSLLLGGVASFTYSDPVAGTRTFLAINNDTAGFSAATDAILEITGYNGVLSSLRVY